METNGGEEGILDGRRYSKDKSQKISRDDFQDLSPWEGLAPGGGRVGCPSQHSSSSQGPRVDRIGGQEGLGQRQGRDIDTDSLSFHIEGNSEEGQTRLGGEMT